MKNNFDFNLKIVIYILIFNLLIAIVYLVLGFLKGDKKKGLMMAGFILISPLIGPLYLSISWLVYEIFFKRKGKIVSMEELSFSKDRIKVVERDDIKVASNKVSIEEALMVSSSKNTRRLLLDILKDDTQGYINSIYSATDNKDSEVSHYAASSIADIMNKFKQNERSLRDRYYEDKSNMELGREYWRYSSEFLTTNILPTLEQKRYVDLLKDFLIDGEKDHPYMFTARIYYTMAELYFHIDQMEEAKIWVDKALENKRDDLYSYKAGLKFYYMNKDRDKYIDLLEELIDSDINLDNETLELVRFYKL